MPPAPSTPKSSRRSDVLAGGSVAVVVLAGVVVGTWGSRAAGGEPLPSVGGWALLVAPALALVGMRARPLLTLGATGLLVAAQLALGGSFGPMLLTVGVASYAAARRAPVGRAVVVAAAVLVALWLPQWWQTPTTPVSGTTPDGLLGLLPLAAWVAVPFSVGYARRVRAQAAERARVFVLQERLAAERLRLSQDVHDVVGHGLAAIKMQADVALHVLGDRAPASDGSDDPGPAALRAISASAASALDELREVLGALGATRVEPGRGGSAGLGDLPALRDRIRDAGLDLRWTGTDDLTGLTAPVDRAAYRVLQEGLTNVLRHGDTDAPVTVQVERDDDELRLLIANRVANRVAARTRATTGGVGLTGMRSRVEAVGGRVEAHHHADGFLLEARLPTGAIP